MRLSRSYVQAITGLALGAALVAAAPSALAAPDLAGTWESASLRSGGPGFTLVVTAADSDPTNAYNVVVRYRPAGATSVKRVKAGMTQTGSQAFLLLNGKGGIADASNPNIMKGTIGQDGSLYFPTCLKQLPRVSKGKPAELCLFQESPN